MTQDGKRLTIALNHLLDITRDFKVEDSIQRHAHHTVLRESSDSMMRPNHLFLDPAHPELRRLNAA